MLAQLPPAQERSVRAARPGGLPGDCAHRSPALRSWGGRGLTLQPNRCQVVLRYWAGPSPVAGLCGGQWSLSPQGAPGQGQQCSSQESLQTAAPHG